MPRDREQPEPPKRPTGSEYRRPRPDLFRDDSSTAPAATMAFLLLSPAFALIGYMLADRILGWSLGSTLAFAAGFGLAAGYTVKVGSTAFARWIGASAGSVVVPSGATTPYQRQFSAIDALAISGRVEEALEAYESEVRATPHDVEVIVRTAELYIEHKRTPERAAELLRSVRRLPGVRPERVLYASHRLVDLYLGPLNDRGRAIVELRVIIDTFPGSQAATFAREGLARLKRDHHADGAG